MSTEVWYVVLLVALAFASYSLSVLLGFSPVFGRKGTNVFVRDEERLRRALLVLGSATVGILAAGSAFGWEEWPVGLLFGVAVVEIGPVAVVKSRAALSRLFGKVGK